MCRCFWVGEWVGGSVSKVSVVMGLKRITQAYGQLDTLAKLGRRKVSLYRCVFVSAYQRQLEACEDVETTAQYYP
jgi:hypothetical protein